MKYHLLTGATGLLGRYLLRDLTLADVPLAVVARRSRVESAAQRIETSMAYWENELGRALVRPVVLEGDITQANLGFNSRDAAWVATNVDTVIHSAASLTFYAEDAEGEPWRSNIHGTRNMLELCRRAGIRKFHHVSTAYVCGRRRERILETELDLGQEPSNDYERSKIASEKEVLASGAFDTVTVHRPSIIVGDARTGYTTSYHGFYTPLRLAYTLVQNVSWETFLQGNWLGGLELSGDERKNLVPVDWVSAAMTHLIAHPELHGRTYHLTNPQPVTVADMLATMGTILGEILMRQGPARSDKIRGEEMIDSFREQMKVYRSYWSDDPDFDSTHTAAALPHLPCPTIDGTVMDRLSRFAIDTNFGWPKESPALVRHALASQLQPWLAAGEGLSAPDASQDYLSLRVSGSGGGQWHLVIRQGQLVAAGQGLRNGDGTTCCLTSDTLSQLAHGQLTWDTALHTGRLVVTGDSVPPRQAARFFRDLVQQPSPTQN
jgi:thioester reductase-like protein